MVSKDKKKEKRKKNKKEMKNRQSADFLNCLMKF
jgi:hypothetical protein